MTYEILSASLNGQLNIVQDFINSGIDCDLIDEHGNTPLSYSAISGHLEIVQYLVEKGANINLQNTDGITAFMLAFAAESEHFEIVRYLVEKGANYNHGYKLEKSISNGRWKLFALCFSLV